MCSGKSQKCINQTCELQWRIWIEYIEKTAKATASELTSESPVYSLDSPVQQIEAQFLNQSDNPPGGFHSGQALSDGRGWTSELRPQLHSESLRVHSQKVCNDTYMTTYVIMKEDTLYLLPAFDDKTVWHSLFWLTFALHISDSAHLF